jgi:hypothetical protein
MKPPLFVPIIDNGMGLSRTSWAFSMIAALSGRAMTLQRISYPYPDGSMNIACADFLASDSDEMVVIDTDIIFSRQHLDWLLEHDEPLVFGLYPKKEAGLNFPCETLDATGTICAALGALCEVKRTARGFMRLNRSVLLAMMPHVPVYECAQRGGRHYEFFKTLPGGHSEDFAFCDLWRSLGGRVMVDPRITAQHEGSAVYPIPGTFTP